MPNIALFLLLALSTIAAASDPVFSTREISPRLLVFLTSSGNVIASVGDDGALLIGTPSTSSTPEISRILASKTKSPARYVIIWPSPLTHSQGDAGWGKLGAFVVMQEKALERLGGHAMGPIRALPRQLISLGIDRPRVAFSEVITFDLNGDAIHVVHQTPGYSDADAIAHFHVDNVIYLGEVFPGNGYPLIDTAQGGNLEGLLKTLHSWAGGHIRVVPARGEVSTGADLQDFVNMIVAVRDRVQNALNAHHTEEQIVSSHPTADFEARWGRGRVSADAFVREVYQSLAQK